MTHKKGISTALIVLLGFGFLTNSVTTSQAADQDTNFNVSKSLVENTIKPTLLSKKFKEDQIKEEKENKLADIKFEEKLHNQETRQNSLQQGLNWNDPEDFRNYVIYDKDSDTIPWDGN